jgi:hypothetical protein
MLNPELGLFALVLAAVTSSASAQTLFRSEPLTRSGVFTRHIEGPAVDAAGSLYVCL